MTSSLTAWSMRYAIVILLMSALTTGCRSEEPISSKTHDVIDQHDPIGRAHLKDTTSAQAAENQESFAQRESALRIGCGRQVVVGSGDGGNKSVYSSYCYAESERPGGNPTGSKSGVAGFDVSSRTWRYYDIPGFGALDRDTTQSPVPWDILTLSGNTYLVHWNESDAAMVRDLATGRKVASIPNIQAIWSIWGVGAENGEDRLRVLSETEDLGLAIVTVQLGGQVDAQQLHIGNELGLAVAATAINRRGATELDQPLPQEPVSVFLVAREDSGRLELCVVLHDHRADPPSSRSYLIKNVPFETDKRLADASGSGARTRWSQIRFRAYLSGDNHLSVALAFPGHANDEGMMTVWGAPADAIELPLVCHQREWFTGDSGGFSLRAGLGQAMEFIQCESSHLSSVLAVTAPTLPTGGEVAILDPRDGELLQLFRFGSMGHAGNSIAIAPRSGLVVFGGSDAAYPESLTSRGYLYGSSIVQGESCRLTAPSLIVDVPASDIPR